MWTSSLQSWIICISRTEIPCEETKAMTAKITKRQIFFMLKFCRGILSRPPSLKSGFQVLKDMDFRWLKSISGSTFGVWLCYWDFLGADSKWRFIFIQRVLASIQFLLARCSLYSGHNLLKPRCITVYLFGHALGWKYFQPDFCETLISISKLRLSRQTLISFSISTLNFSLRTLILILNSQNFSNSHSRIST